eukprot:362630-Chlamydomonas_euryale.AAC.5
MEDIMAKIALGPPVQLVGHSTSITCVALQLEPYPGSSLPHRRQRQGSVSRYEAQLLRHGRRCSMLACFGPELYLPHGCRRTVLLIVADAYPPIWNVHWGQRAHSSMCAYRHACMHACTRAAYWLHACPGLMGERWGLHVNPTVAACMRACMDMHARIKSF